MWRGLPISLRQDRNDDDAYARARRGFARAKTAGDRRCVWPAARTICLLGLREVVGRRRGARRRGSPLHLSGGLDVPAPECGAGARLGGCGARDRHARGRVRPPPRRRAGVRAFHACRRDLASGAGGQSGPGRGRSAAGRFDRADRRARASATDPKPHPRHFAEFGGAADHPGRQSRGDAGQIERGRRTARGGAQSRGDLRASRRDGAGERSARSVVGNGSRHDRAARRDGVCARRIDRRTSRSCGSSERARCQGGAQTRAYRTRADPRSVRPLGLGPRARASGVVAIDVRTARPFALRFEPLDWGFAGDGPSRRREPGARGASGARGGPRVDRCRVSHARPRRSVGLASQAGRDRRGRFDGRAPSGRHRYRRDGSQARSRDLRYRRPAASRGCRGHFRGLRSLGFLQPSGAVQFQISATARSARGVRPPWRGLRRTRRDGLDPDRFERRAGESERAGSGSGRRQDLRSPNSPTDVGCR